MNRIFLIGDTHFYHIDIVRLAEEYGKEGDIYE